jgi:hypothetical protein
VCQAEPNGRFIDAAYDRQPVSSPKGPSRKSPPQRSTPSQRDRETPSKSGGATPSKGGRATPSKGARATPSKGGRAIPSKGGRGAPAARGANAARTPQRAPAPSLRTAWWQQTWVIPGAVLLVAAIIGVVVLAGRAGSGSAGSGGSLPGNALSSPAPAALVATVTSVPASTYTAVGDGGVAQPFKVASGQPPLTGSGGKPVLLYIGADYCPFCAAERWSLVLALSRFGQLGGLALTTSSSSDVYPNTNTWDFSHLTFTSSVLDVQAVELQDRNQQQLQTPNPSQAAAFQALAPSAAIPFVDIGNRFTGGLSDGYGPQLLQGLSWDQIAQKLSNPSDPVTKGIVGHANRITAAICAVTNNQPASVCGAAPIPQLVSQLPSS